MIQEKEDDLFCKRILELSHQSFIRGINVYTHFLNLNEQNLFYNTINGNSEISYDIWGGYKEAERRVVCFYNSDSFHHIKVSYPISCICIRPKNIKYSDVLTHRDYLGAVLNLQIDRSKIGDILVEDTYAYMFVISDIQDFICENLTKVKHTYVILELVHEEEISIHPKMEEIIGTINSVRLDSILSVAFHSSRSGLAGLTAGGKVFVNGRIILSNHYVPKEEEIISVRGHGKFIFKEIMEKTKKDRYKILIQKYI